MIFTQFWRFSLQHPTLDKFGFWEYLDIFSRDRFIKGPSGLVNMEAWRRAKES